MTTSFAEVAGLAPRTAPYQIAACVDASSMAQKVIAHAVAVAKALHAELTLIRVLEVRPAGRGRPDPIEWELLRREVRASVKRFVEAQNEQIEHIKTEVIEGQVAEQIWLWARDHDIDLTVLCTHGESSSTTWDIGGTVRRVIDKIAGSILLVPCAVADADVVRYRRILVALDGSPRAESVLPLAIRLSEAHHAEVVLVHVVPIPELTEIGPVEAEALTLRDRLICRNERVAREYLDRVRDQVANQGISARGLLLRDGDVRRRLSRAIADEQADLVVLSAQGRSGHLDVPHGSIAAYQIAHAATPLLIVGSREVTSRRSTASATSCADLRLPEHATR